MISLPRVGITMGDPAGIGPEIVAKALATREVYDICIPEVYGDVQWMEQISRRVDCKLCVVSALAPGSSTDRVSDRAVNEHCIIVRQATDANLSGVRLGFVSASAGKAAAESVIVAAGAATAGNLDAIVTAPINKEAIRLGGYPYAGHTELLAAITGTTTYGMLLLAGSLRVVHVSTHVPLSDAIARVKTARILQCIRLGYEACKQLGIGNPRIAVAGLNPHAGENGLIGSEDHLEIAPAVKQAQDSRIDATGPHPPDTIFARAARGEFDLVVAMYHDQGHIPVKLLGFDEGVNVTIGLPIIRTSVDHGTAFDIAGKGIARENSLLQAIRIAVTMAAARRAQTPG